MEYNRDKLFDRKPPCLLIYFNIFEEFLQMGFFSKNIGDALQLQVDQAITFSLPQYLNAKLCPAVA